MPMKKILIIEDNEAMGKTLVDELSRAGFSPTRTVDAYQGQQAVLRLKPDLIILDLMLPAGNGIELLRNLRASFQTQNLPVVIVTSYQDAEVQKEAETIGVQGYFNKPFDNAELIQKIKVILGPHQSP